MTAALVAAAHGQHVTLVERQEVGGNAVWHSLLPSKVHLHLAALSLELAPYRGTVSFPSGWSRQERTRAVTGEAARRWRQELVERGVRLVSGEAHLPAPGRVAVRGEEGEEVLPADVVVIATGSLPHVPPGVRPDEERILLPRAVAHLESVPASLLVAGGGPSGVEFAYLFAQLGSRVTLATAEDRLLSTEDEDVADAVARSLKRQGVELRYRSRLAAATRDGEGVVADVGGSRVRCEALLLATGRRPAHMQMGLQELGVRLTDQAWIDVDDRARTTVPGVYAVGDATGRPQVANKAQHQAKAAVHHALGLPWRTVPAQEIPVAVFSRPEIARVGPTERALQQAGISYHTYRAPLGDCLRAVLDGEEEGYVKVLASEDGRVLGGTVVGGWAAEAVSTLALAVALGARVDDVTSLAYVSPTYAETFQRLQREPAG